MADQGLVRETAVAIVGKLKSGEVTPLDLLDVLERRIAEVDGKVNALPTLCFDRARKHATALMKKPVSERGLLGVLFSRRARPADAVDSAMESPLPVLGASEPVSKAIELLVDTDALLVLDDGKPTGVLTRQDLLADVG